MWLVLVILEDEKNSIITKQKKVKIEKERNSTIITKYKYLNRTHAQAVFIPKKRKSFD